MYTSRIGIFPIPGSRGLKRHLITDPDPQHWTQDSKNSSIDKFVSVFVRGMESEKLQLLAELAKQERKALEKNLKHRGNHMFFLKTLRWDSFLFFPVPLLVFSVPDSFRLRRSNPDRDKKESYLFKSLPFWNIKQWSAFFIWCLV